MSAEELDLFGLLSAPFTDDEVKFKPAAVSGSRALALPYVDARVIQDRLDEVAGVAGWQDTYECLPDGSVVCALSLKINGEWICKMDVGGQSEQPDEGDRRKAAFSDALKRAAVKWGIGRYLYRLEPQWADYDPQKKRIVKPPVIAPAVARIAAKPAARPAAQGAANGTPPASGAELLRRLAAYEDRMRAVDLCVKGELLAAVVAAGVRAGHGSDLLAWSGAAISLAVEEAKAFEAAQRGRNGKAVPK
jgi:hypothetical protein